MTVPSSLSDEILLRAFRASNGELGIRRQDITAFLLACESDGQPLFGWELWIVDHRMGITGIPIPSPGQWTGGIPTRARGIAFLGGEGGLDETRREIGALDLEAVIERRWIEHVRFNFTVEGG